MIADRYDVDPAYFAEKYAMPVGERRNPTLTLPQGEGEETGGKKKMSWNSPSPWGRAGEGSSFFD